MDIAPFIRDIPDFPKKGIIFKDITPLLAEPKAFEEVINQFCDFAKQINAQVISGIESRGFIFGAAVAYKLGLKFVPIRKKGKLPYQVVSESYDLEYGSSTIEMHTDAIKKDEQVLLVDDLLATGGTMKAACNLIEKQGGKVAGIAFVIDLAFLKGAEKLKPHKIFSLLKYD
ncbi:MAG: adenine phosphoribosyltransferase, adenine phosphoribosyltransferase [Candidatus Peregrinibacteria bacterium GW2011_GWC2_39_14]|nr:MAG: Adenine phosphoribosyltransferase [Candidatus Peregrinibacteria bacterium GW2011_GWA2_38_36]KKR05924.1 MAG: adenine phosphoribosyltransferase, adenine phosphoribosyltransferase [Candidatus Peregrinibacteria bacterium GW2011_GWC2_39_14]